MEGNQNNSINNTSDRPTSKLLSIPPELRNKIYHYAFHQIEGHIAPRPFRCAAKPLPGVLLACKQIHNEAIGIYQASISIHIDQKSHHPAAALMSVPKEYLDLVLEICFVDIYPIFGADHSSIWPMRSRAQAGTLLGGWVLRPVGLDYMHTRLDQMGLCVPRKKLKVKQVIDIGDGSRHYVAWSSEVPLWYLEREYGTHTLQAALAKSRSSGQEEIGRRLWLWALSLRWKTLAHMVMEDLSIVEYTGASSIRAL